MQLQNTLCQKISERNKNIHWFIWLWIKLGSIIIIPGPDQYEEIPTWNAPFTEPVFILGRSFAGGTWECESHVTHARRAFSGSRFSSYFSFRDVKRGRRERQRGKISWYSWNAIAAELKTQFFLWCTGLNLSSRLLYIFWFGHSSLLGSGCVFLLY